MRILRPLILGGIIVLSTAVIGFVSVDRVSHSSFPAPPRMTIARGAVPPAAEPETTGTLTQGTIIQGTIIQGTIIQGMEPREPRQARTLDGFDTERLNALMRGEVLPVPPKPKPVASARSR